MTACTTNTIAASDAGRTNAPRKGFLQLFLTLTEARRQRRRLAGLDDHLLRDIGLTREDADREATRKPWDVPAHWLR